MNFSEFKNEIKIAVKEAVVDIKNQHASEEIYAVSLFSDSDGMTVCCNINTKEALLESDDPNDPYYKFDPAEWCYEDGAENLQSALSKKAAAASEAIPADSEDFDNYLKELFKCCIEALEELKNECYFKQLLGNDVFLFFTVYDYDFSKEEIINQVTRLNDNEYLDEYLNWANTWLNN